MRDRIFYDPDAWGDRLHLREAAQRVLGGGTWPCVCPFCTDVKDRFGHDPQAARAWWHDEGEPEVRIADLHPEAPLGAALPIFATARGSATAVQTRARTAHNHWVIDRLCEQVPSSERARWGMAKLRALESIRLRTTRLGVMASQEVIGALSA